MGIYEIYASFNLVIYVKLCSIICFLSFHYFSSSRASDQALLETYSAFLFARLPFDDHTIIYGFSSATYTVIFMIFSFLFGGRLCLYAAALSMIISLSFLIITDYISPLKFQKMISF